MSGRDWFRNTTWSDDVAAQFDAKLRRARDKSQYLRIQACTLAATHPHVALELLDRYFALGDHFFDESQAFCDRARALLALDRVDDAIYAYERALAREAEFPKSLTNAYLDLPYLIATERIAARYSRALEILNESKGRLMFPVDHFKWHAALALIEAANGDVKAARRDAASALEASAFDNSGFRYHPNIGLVSERDASTVAEMRQIVDA